MCFHCLRPSLLGPLCLAARSCADGFHVFTDIADATAGATPTSPRCRPCPVAGVCFGGLLVPAEFYWHSSPESEDLRLCPNPTACSSARVLDDGTVFINTGERARKLYRLQQSMLAAARAEPASSGAQLATATELILTGRLANDQYTEGLCAEGYTGALCSACTRGFGRTRSSECLRCPAHPSTTVTWYSLIVVYNAAFVYLTLRATLEQSRRSQRAAAAPLMGPVMRVRVVAKRLTCLTASPAVRASPAAAPPAC